jgi:TonB-linked SusC/RagA family outer membrane protein
MKNRRQVSFGSISMPFKYVLLTKFSIALMFIFSLQTFAGIKAQDSISLNLQNVALTKVFKAIEKQGTYRFVYKNEIIPVHIQVSIEVRNASLENVLNIVLENTSLSFRKMNNNLVVITPLNATEKVTAAPVPPVFALQVNGKIMNDSGEPLAGATVEEKGTGNKTTTKNDGSFSLLVLNEKAVLIISYVGYTTKEITALANPNNLLVQLSPTTQALENVVVVGFGRQKKESVVGAISQTNAAVLQRAGGVSNIGAALTGNVPGITTIQGMGTPGLEDPLIFIRGQSTWNNSSPLILVDGIERSMNGLDIQSVQSISVLKDASATAVFGVKGANGVILITTKRGSVGKANINITLNTIMKVPSRLPKKYDSYDALKIRNLAIEREVAIIPAAWADYTPYAELNKYRNPKDLTEAERYPNVDWVDESVDKSAMSYNPNISISGGTDFVKYFTSVDFLHEGDVMKAWDNGKGYTPGFGYDRLNVRSNLDFKLTNTTTLSANLAGLFGNRKSTTSGFEYTLWQAAYVNPPDIMMPRYANGYWGYYAPDNVSVANSVFLISNGGVRYTKTTQFNTDFALNQNLGMLVKGLSAKGTFSLDNTFVSLGGINDGGDANQQYINPVTGVIQPRNTIGRNQFDFVVTPWGIAADAMQNGSTRRQIFYQLQLNETLKIGKHNITGMGLFQRNQLATGSEFPNYREDWVFRTTYNYAGKYFAEINGAYNGSEKFSDAYRFKFFPSAAVGWMLSEEKFMQKLDWLDMFKIRGSYGLVGNDNINGRWLYQDIWTFGGNARLNDLAGTNSPYAWYRQPSIGNAEVHWETVAKTNIGVDYTILGGLVEGSVDVFNDYRTDILIDGNARAVPAYFGAVAPTANLGIVRTKGYEIELKFNKRFGKDLRVWVNANMTHAKDKVIEADDPGLYFAYQKKEGHQINQTRSIIRNGFYNTWDEVYGSVIQNANDPEKLPGNFYFVDYNADGVINDFDRVPYAYPERPQNTYNATIGFDYKGFSAFAQFYAVNNVTRNMQQTNFANSLNAVYPQGEYWTRDNTNGDLPMPRWRSRVYSHGDFYNRDGSYLRLKTAEIAYSLKGNLIKRVGIQSLRVFLNGSNLVLWTKMPDDREANLGGTSGGQGAYPTVRRYNLGINMSL